MASRLLPAQSIARAAGAALFGLILGLPLSAQAPVQAQGGRIVGKVVDRDGGVPLGGARITIVGTSLSTSTKVDGRFAFQDVPAGTVTLRAAMIGYAPKSVVNVIVTEGGVTTQDISLGSEATQLEELTVTAQVEQGSVNAALDEQRYSVAIVNAISAEQIARSPDSDAAAALQRMSGATIQDGKYLNMRGLGDRYTQASLNGARIPSPEPERKVVPLDLFPSALLSEITTAKTFTPDQAGDFSGGAVNIKTREFPGRRYLAFSVSAGFNDAVTGKSAVFAPATGRDWVALGATPRGMPSSLEQVDFTQPLSPAQANTLVNSFRNVWSARRRSGSPNGGFGVSLGGTLPTGGTGLSYLLSGSYSYTQEIRTDQRRAIAQPPSTPGGAATELDRYDGTTGRNSALWGGIANFSVNLGDHTRVLLNNTYNRTMDNEGRLETGVSENLALPLQVQRLRYVERNIYASQLGVHREVAERHFLDAGFTVSGVQRKEPDRSEVVYETSTGTPTWYGFSNEAAVRTFADLNERFLRGVGELAVPLRLGRREPVHPDRRAVSLDHQGCDQPGLLDLAAPAARRCQSRPPAGGAFRRSVHPGIRGQFPDFPRRPGRVLRRLRPAQRGIRHAHPGPGRRPRADRRSTGRTFGGRSALALDRGRALARHAELHRRAAVAGAQLPRRAEHQPSGLGIADPVPSGVPRAVSDPVPRSHWGRQREGQSRPEAGPDPEL